MPQVRVEPATPHSLVKHSINELLRSRTKSDGPAEQCAQESCSNLAKSCQNSHDHVNSVDPDTNCLMSPPEKSTHTQKSKSCYNINQLMRFAKHALFTSEIKSEKRLILL